MKVSRQIHEIFQSVTPKVEPLSLDEAYLDVTENLLNDPLASRIAKHIRARIFEELGLTASAGVAPNKFIAKIASDLRKPNGLVVIPPDQVATFMEKLPVEKFWGVGPATAKKLNEQGLWTASDIRKKTPEEMETILGSHGRFLHGLAHGIDPRQVEPDRPSKSTGCETTFERDILDLDLLHDTLKALGHEIAHDLSKLGRPGKTITLKLRYSDFHTITRSRTIQSFTQDSDAIFRIASELLHENTEAGRRPVRLIGISVSGLWDGSQPEQLCLGFPPPWDI